LNSINLASHSASLAFGNGKVFCLSFHVPHKQQQSSSNATEIDKQTPAETQVIIKTDPEREDFMVLSSSTLQAFVHRSKAIRF